MRAIRSRPAEVFLGVLLFALGPGARLAAEDRKLPEDLKDVLLEEFGVKPVLPREDPKTGFVVGGKNATALIRGLKEINGRAIADLESDMRPAPEGFSDRRSSGADLSEEDRKWLRGNAGGQRSTSGFLGRDESLLEVMAEDNRYVVEELGRTHQDLAKVLHVMGAVGDHQPREFVYHGRRFEVVIKGFKGDQLSPFLDGTLTSREATVRNLENGQGMWYSLLVPHLIERYGFYEGKGTPYRVEPRRVVEVFDFLRPGTATAEAPAAAPVRPTGFWWVAGLIGLITTAAAVVLWLRGRRVGSPPPE